MEIYPAYFTLLGLIFYVVAYLVYAKWYDRNVWKPDPKATTPAHMYMDGVEFFPSSKYVLYGFQFKGIAGAAPIVGPFVALSFGWLPALIWILLGNFFIGWIHDYGAVFASVRNEGKTLGPLTYELIGPRARSCLMGFLIFYLITITAAFLHVCSILFVSRGGGLIFMIFIVIAGLISGVMLYRMKISIGIVTVIGIIVMIIGLYLGAYVFPLVGAIPYEGVLFATAVICFIGAVVPIIWYAQPVNYMAFWPCIAGIILLIIGALLTPATGVTVIAPAFGTSFPMGPAGPVWPILFVSIACGAISGWHSLVGTSGSARQLDVETDALPIGAGSMLTEGLLALAALGAYMVVATPEIVALGKFGAFPFGAAKLAAPLLFVSEADPALLTFFTAFIAIFAITVLQLVIRFFRLGMTEIMAPWPALRASLGNKYVGALIGLLVGGAFAWAGAWINLWTLFGGANQLMAGMALLLVSVYLATVKKPTKFNLLPAIFMILTCEAALLWEAYLFATAVMTGKPIAAGHIAAYPGVALGFNVVFGIMGIVLFILGAIVTFDASKALSRAWKAEKVV